MTYRHKTVMGGQLAKVPQHAIIRPNGEQYCARGQYVTLFDILIPSEVRNNVNRHNLGAYHKYFSQDFW